MQGRVWLAIGGWLGAGLLLGACESRAVPLRVWIPADRVGDERQVATVDVPPTAVALAASGGDLIVAWNPGDDAGKVFVARSRDRGMHFDPIEQVPARAAEPVAAVSTEGRGRLMLRSRRGPGSSWWPFGGTRPALDVQWGAERRDEDWSIVTPGDAAGARIEPPGVLRGGLPSTDVAAPLPGSRLDWIGPDEQLNVVGLWSDRAYRTVVMERYFVNGAAAHRGVRSFGIPIVVATDLAPESPVTGLVVPGGAFVAFVQRTGLELRLVVREVGFDLLCGPSELTVHIAQGVTDVEDGAATSSRRIQ